MKKTLKEKDINIIYNKKVKEITADKVIFEDGESISTNAAVWATGADPHVIKSDLNL